MQVVYKTNLLKNTVPENLSDRFRGCLETVDRDKNLTVYDGDYESTSKKYWEAMEDSRITMVNIL